MKLRRRRKPVDQNVELDITAFMNLMVILVPFLLITAVFTRTTVLELNLPALNALENQPADQKITLQLQILIREDSLTIRDAVLGEFKTLKTATNGKPLKDMDRKVWKPFREVLVEIKSRFPEEQDVSLLLGRDVSYRSMIEVMDRVRAADVVIAATLENVELFPNVSIGDLPLGVASVEAQ